MSREHQIGVAITNIVKVKERRANLISAIFQLLQKISFILFDWCRLNERYSRNQSKTLQISVKINEGENCKNVEYSSHFLEILILLNKWLKTVFQL
jgi:hypothetical protein